MTVEWDAWLAGFIDGEGCILIDISQYDPSLRIANSAVDALEKVRSREGGFIVSIAGKNRPAHWKLGFEWRLASPPAIRELLERVRPYMQVKQKEAWLMLEYLAQRTVQTNRQPITSGEAALRHGFRLALQIAKVKTV